MVEGTVENLLRDETNTSDHLVYSNLLRLYYRQPLPFSMDDYKSFHELPLAKQAEMQNDLFWNKIGKFIHVLDFSDTEKTKFAAAHEIEPLVLFLIFEHDLNVLELVYSNPRLSTKLLMDYINLIKERDLDREDDKALRLAQRILKRRSKRIIHAREIHKASENFDDDRNVFILLSYLVNDDPFVRAAAENGLSKMSSERLRKIIVDPNIITKLRAVSPTATAVDLMEMLTSAVKLVLKTLMATHDLGMKDRTDPTGAMVGLRHALQTRKLNELEKCAEEPSELFNVTMLAYLHFDPYPVIRNRAREILSLDDIMDLIIDESTPRTISRAVLKLLEQSTEDNIRQKITDLRLKEAERIAKKMKEIEVSVNAYFDVIFQSLNYARINSQRESVQALRNAADIMKEYFSEANNLEMSSVTVTQGIIRKAIEHFENNITHLYGDTKVELYQEFEEIQSMIRNILDLKMFQFEAQSEKAEALDETVLAKVITIWRNAISNYLGRLKDLEEMLRIKWTNVMTTAYSRRQMESAESELYIAFEEIENTHKDSVECRLKIPCRECKRRGCASERFLLQVDFLLDEIKRIGKPKANS